jgi:hypothetical protein
MCILRKLRKLHLPIDEAMSRKAKRITRRENNFVRNINFFARYFCSTFKFVVKGNIFDWLHSKVEKKIWRWNATYIYITLGLNGIMNQTQYFYTFKFEGQKKRNQTLIKWRCKGCVGNICGLKKVLLRCIAS